MTEAPQVTVLLRKWKAGDSAALEELTPLVYGELRRLAASYLRRERDGHTLQPTALLNEAYLRLAAVQEQDWADRAHFYGVAAHLMRLILVDHARAKHRKKRGSGQANVQFDEAWSVATSKDEVLVDLDTQAREHAESLGLNMLRAATVGIHPRFIAMIRELIEERLNGFPLAEGCLQNCCPSPHALRQMAGRSQQAPAGS